MLVENTLLKKHFRDATISLSVGAAIGFLLFVFNSTGMTLVEFLLAADLVFLAVVLVRFAGVGFAQCLLKSLHFSIYFLPPAVTLIVALASVVSRVRAPAAPPPRFCSC